MWSAESVPVTLSWPSATKASAAFNSRLSRLSIDKLDVRRFMCLLLFNTFFQQKQRHFCQTLTPRRRTVTARRKKFRGYRLVEPTRGTLAHAEARLHRGFMWDHAAAISAGSGSS